MNALAVLFHEKGLHKRVAKKEVVVMRRLNIPTFLTMFVAVAFFAIPLGCGCEMSHGGSCCSGTNSHASCVSILQMAPHQCGMCLEQLILVNNSNAKQGLSHKTLTRVPALLLGIFV